MTHYSDNMPADTQSVTDMSTGVYEAVATLEHGGHQATRSAVIVATGLADDVVDRCTVELISAGLLVAADDGYEPVYAPAVRGWSAAPEQAEGHHLH
jgi:hypothetical protein